jgi:hypothetical protein
LCFFAAAAGVDPANISVRPTIQHIQSAMGGVPKHHRLLFTEVHDHDRFADRYGGDLSRRFGDDNGTCLPVRNLFLDLFVNCGQDILLGDLPVRLFGAVAVVVAEPAFVAAQPLADPVRGDVESERI